MIIKPWEVKRNWSQDILQFSNRDNKTKFHLNTNNKELHLHKEILGLGLLKDKFKLSHKLTSKLISTHQIDLMQLQQ